MDQGDRPTSADDGADDVDRPVDDEAVEDNTVDDGERPVDDLDTDGDDGRPAAAADDGFYDVDRTIGDDAVDESLLHRFRHDTDGPLMWVREMLSSALIVLVLGLLLFAVSGVWPPMVAVESGSMEPNMEVGDLVFVTEPGRFAPDAANNDIGVVTSEAGEAAGYETFGSYGSVIIFQPPDRTASPIIHRAMFHVEAGEDWYDRADERFHRADDCSDLRNCPAPHDGFVTLGDNNGQYDQVNGLSEPVKAEWVTGVARLRVPYLGYIRLIATGQADTGDVLSVAMPIDPVIADETRGGPEPVGNGTADVTGYSVGEVGDGSGPMVGSDGAPTAVSTAGG